MEIFLFPVGHMLLYPSFSKPFYIIEPHYIQMVEESIRTGTPVAVGSVSEPFRRHEFKIGEKVNFVNEVVGFGIPVIVERKQDGTLVVFLEGRGKARLGKVLDRRKPFIVCEAEQIEENHEMHQHMHEHFLTVHKIMINWMNAHIPDENSRDQFLNYIKTPEQVIGCYASYLVADHDLQQLILESNDINEKVLIVNRIISSKGLVA